MRWPLKNAVPLFPDEPGQFGAVRKHDVHTGVDLYCEKGGYVQSMEAGVVIDIVPFTGEVASPPTPFWNNTWAVVIQGEHGILLYGEIVPLPEIMVGMQVQEGQEIGCVMPVLKSFKGRPMCMLHMEAYSTYSTPVEWLPGPMPAGLKDVTPILESCTSVRDRFDMSRYLGLVFRDFQAEVKPSSYYTNKASVVVLESDGKVLFLHRGDTAPRFPNMWGLPGGMGQGEETETETAARELYEEAGIHVDSFEFLFYESTHGILVSVYKASIGTTNVKLSSEHKDYRWVDGVDDLNVAPMTYRIMQRVNL